MRLLLDTNLLIRACHPKSHPDVRAWLQAWLERAGRLDGVELVVSAVADYEARRGYLSEIDRKDDERKALERLDELCALLGVQQVSADNFLDAAKMWARARRSGKSTASERDVDWDVLIAAQAKEMAAQPGAMPVVVVTKNAKHLKQHGAEAQDWRELPVPEETPGA
ncbi:MAG: PIN domain-containing protein [Phycisphaeraceae bacterium]|nr:PIN domain-containing protein [Phycisphaeraceae bacterium]